jgi:hypothetical protein
MWLHAFVSQQIRQLADPDAQVKAPAQQTLQAEPETEAAL